MKTNYCVVESMFCKPIDKVPIVMTEKYEVDNVKVCNSSNMTKKFHFIKN